MVYEHLSRDERYAIAQMRSMGYSHREIGRCLGRSASTISREVRRNGVGPGKYWVDKAHSRAVARRRRSRRNSQYSHQTWSRVCELLRQEWSPKQVVGTMYVLGQQPMSYQTIYRGIRKDRLQGGSLWRHMRHMGKLRRKRKGSPATRGRMAGKRHISERPQQVELRREIGHVEIDTVMGPDGRHCVLTMVERVSRYVAIKKLRARSKEQANRALSQLLRAGAGVIKTITADNGTEFHGYKDVEQEYGVPFYFSTPYHSWERGTSENTNGLIRQYLPKGMCLKNLTQAECDRIARKLNDRPRERLGFRTPAQVLTALAGVALQM
jgi:IS30 family transposase